MAEAETNKTTGDTGTAGRSRLLSSDAAPDAQPADSEQQYFVDGQAVTREAYMEALPKAGYVPERMPANHYPAISIK